MYTVVHACLQAIRFLHETGVVLHYEDAATRLNEYYILDPEWLCRMMAQVITVREINPFVDNRGVCSTKISDIIHVITCNLSEPW